MNPNSSRTDLSDSHPSAAREMQAGGSLRVLLIGSTGFIGSRILRALQSRSGVRVSILTRRPTAFFSDPAPVVHLGDVTDPDSVHNAVKNADVVINAASYIGNDSKRAQQVNEQGTWSIIRACEISNVRRLIQISTTAVYGSGPHRALCSRESSFHAESIASRSRAAADNAAQSAGGIVVRPNLIYGDGDRWFIPGAVKMFKTLGTTVENGQALMSTIDVSHLGLLVAALAVKSSPVAGAYHVAYQTPVALSHVLETINRHITPLNIHGSSSIQEAVRTLEPAGFSPHQIHMLGLDHYYESQELWDLTGMKSTSFQIKSATQAWYRSRLSST